MTIDSKEIILRNAEKIDINSERLARIEVMVLNCNEMTKKILDKIEHFNRTTELETKLEMHINDEKEKKNWKRTLIVSLIAMCTSITVALLYIFL
jgi:hypothetical protein